MRTLNGIIVASAMTVSAASSLAACDSTEKMDQPITGATAGNTGGVASGPPPVAGTPGPPTMSGVQPSGAGGGPPALAGGGGTPGVAGAGSGGVAGEMAGAEPQAGSDGGEEMEAETCDMVIPPSTDCSAMLAPGDERTCMIGSRSYIVHAGATLNPCKPTALVIDAHGATETAPQQRGIEAFCSGSLCWEGLGSGWAAESDTPGGGFIAVFPQGISNRWSASDADFMLQIVDAMKKLADIDPEKVYISGISNGGFLTFQTGCPHSDVFRGMAPNAGGSSCTSVKRPIPLISFDAEPDFAYAGHQTANMSVVTANHCQGEAKPWITVDSKYEEAVCRTAKQDTMAKLVPCTQVTSAPVEPTVCKIWDQCDEGVKVAWCDVAPNTEHGAANAATDAHIIYENNTILNTPSLAWRFFKLFWK
jgi:poly(3-hydroxybutyrate) depolymerase